MHSTRNSADRDRTDSADLIAELTNIYGDDFRPLVGMHHARYLPSDVPFHVISRVFQGRHLLKPLPALNRIIVGVIGRAQLAYPSVRLFANAFLSNHLHLMVQGPAYDLACFVGFIKREISRRWGSYPGIDWPCSMWHSYLATALPTAESQIRCLRYILSQGVKENLVGRPQQWPGVHSAKQLLSGSCLKGEWLDATAYAVARAREARKAHPKSVAKARFYRTYRVTLSQIEPWQDLSPEEYRERIKTICAEIEHEGRLARKGRRPLGVKAILNTPLDHRSELPPQPWLKRRRTLICWSNLDAAETREFIARHWEFQKAFRAASSAYLAGHDNVTFPPEAFRPPGPPMADIHCVRVRRD